MPKPKTRNRSRIGHTRDTAELVARVVALAAEPDGVGPPVENPSAGAIYLRGLADGRNIVLRQVRAIVTDLGLTPHAGE